jgi:hypothetical protein
MVFAAAVPQIPAKDILKFWLNKTSEKLCLAQTRKGRQGRIERIDSLRSWRLGAITFLSPRLALRAQRDCADAGKIARESPMTGAAHGDDFAL